MTGGMPAGGSIHPVLGFESLSELLEGSEPDQELLVEPILTTQSLGALVAPTKAGKTWWECDLLVGVATGADVLGALKVHRPGPVVGVFPEGGRHLIRRRVKAILASVGGRTDDVRFVWVRPGALDLADRSAFNELRAAVRETGAVLVILDSVFLLLPRVNPAALHEMGAVLQALTDLCLEFGCAVVLGHHTNRVREASGLYKSSGAGIAEWSSSFILATPGPRSTVAGTTTWTLSCDLTARDLPELRFESTFSIGAEDPAVLTSALTYAVSTKILEPGPGTDGLGWVEGRVVLALRTLGPEGGTLEGIDDALAADGGPLRYTTLRTALADLIDGGLADGADGRWWATLPRAEDRS